MYHAWRAQQLYRRKSDHEWQYTNVASSNYHVLYLLWNTPLQDTHAKSLSTLTPSKYCKSVQLVIHAIYHKSAMLSYVLHIPLYSKCSAEQPKWPGGFKSVQILFWLWLWWVHLITWVIRFSVVSLHGFTIAIYNYWGLHTLGFTAVFFYRCWWGERKLYGAWSTW